MGPGRRQESPSLYLPHTYPTGRIMAKKTETTPPETPPETSEVTPAPPKEAAPQRMWTISNKEDGGKKLPSVYRSRSDRDSKQPKRVLYLGAACDDGLVGRKQPMVEVNAFEYSQLVDNQLFMNAKSAGMIGVRNGGLDF